ncbi:AAA domain-containing protein [Propionispira arboris]|uniref:AAA domain-containing protein n=1 Tax=Propionispira arboris TaxID=84035 RepID=A0A1H6Y452_9FIRM|nr:AAA family ATPase [Propionispira arboris]SEJ36078.1 AAA domain-containing protein [Propionispira arboris]
MIKINNLEIENVKRVKAVRLEPSQNGLTIIGGKNGQGKTSVLDAIAWVLGGNKFQPSQAQRNGSMTPPHLHIELSNGLIVERKGKNSDLKVIDSKGNKSGQRLLDELVEQLALNLPKFMQASNKEKGDSLLQIIGVGDKLGALDLKEQQLYNRRTEIGRIADQKKKYAAELDMHPDVPKEPVSAAELIRKQQDILARNGENARKRQSVDILKQRAVILQQEVIRMEEALTIKKEEQAKVSADLVIAQKSALDLYDENTAELEKSINNIDMLNMKIRANMDREKAEMDAEEYSKQVDGITQEIADIRKQRTALLNNADLPLPDLSVDKGELTYKGYKWDNMSASEQLKVATAIIRKLNPECGFVLMDKLEQMDIETLQEFGTWLEAEGLQAIATRVSTSDECSIIIEDGYIKGDEMPFETAVPTSKKIWEEGKF